MSWKICLTAFASLLLAALPQNMIGCGPDEDPHDYFTSFFSRNLSNTKEYQPFYYTALLDFYDEWEEDETVNYNEDKIVQEWKQYCNANISTAEAKKFIYDFKKKDIDALIAHLTANKPLQIADSIRNNGMVKCLLAQKNSDAFKYVSLAKATEAFSWTASPWDNPVERDSLVLNKYIGETEKLFAAATTPFLKDKYAYQRCKLAFYNNRLHDCIRWYDSYFTTAHTSAVSMPALSYKAGSLFRLNRNKEAAYYFSKVFSKSNLNKKQTFLGFLWATDFCNEELEKEYAALGQNNQEKAAIHALFGLHGTSFRLQTLEQVLQLDPSSPLLEVVATREINKLEEQYLSPMLAKEKGGKAFYLSWQEEEDSTANKNKAQLINTIRFFEKAAQTKGVLQPAFYFTGAAYLSFINKDYAKAKTYLAKAKNEQISAQLNDQVQLINLLVMANEPQQLTAETEKLILPSVQWLAKKAASDASYHIFFRNLFSEIIAQKYEQQNDNPRAALAYALADARFINSRGENDYYGYDNGIEFIRTAMNTEQLLKLYELFNRRERTDFEQYLVSNSSFSKDDVVDVIGTSYLRDFDFENSVEWLRKSAKHKQLISFNYNYTTNKETKLNVDPFHDYLNDWQRYGKAAASAHTKLSLAEKLIALHKKMDTTKSSENKSKLYYQLASAFYNMSYYGNSWQAVAYNRSSSDWNMGNYQLAWEKEYYGVYRAKEYYQKALDLTVNPEFKAACFFMVAKCLQRQIPKPAYDYDNYEQYEKNMQVYERKFKNNPMFANFVKQYGNTKFYKYTYTRCSYLRDFVARRAANK